VLRRGPLGAAGELGHLVMEPHGAPCGCGGHGCLETISSATAISSEGVRLLRIGMAPRLHEMVQGDVSRITAKPMAEAAARVSAEAGPAEGLAAWARVARRFGQVRWIEQAFRLAESIEATGPARAYMAQLRALDRCVQLHEHCTYLHARARVERDAANRARDLRVQRDALVGDHRAHRIERGAERGLAHFAGRNRFGRRRCLSGTDSSAGSSCRRISSTPRPPIRPPSPGIIRFSEKQAIAWRCRGMSFVN